MAASRSVICRQLIILMCRPVTPEDDILRSFRKKLRMTSVIRKLMIFFDYGLVHEVDVLIISLDPASEPVHYLVRIVKQIFRLAFVTCPYLRTGALTVPDLYREFTSDIVSCIIGIAVMCNAAKACVINYLAMTISIFPARQSSISFKKPGLCAVFVPEKPLSTYIPANIQSGLDLIFFLYSVC